MRALRRQTLFLHLTAGAPAGKPAACRLICSPEYCGAVALSDAGRSCEANSELQMKRRRNAAADTGRLCGRRRMRTPDGLDEAKSASQKNRRRDAAFGRLCGGMRPPARPGGGERTSPCATRQTPRRGRPRPKIRGRLCRRGARRFVPDGNVFPLCAAFVRGRMRRETERALLPRKSRPAQ